MPLETGEFITDLVITNPLGTDPKSQGDDHLRLLKKTVQQSFPAIDAAVTNDSATINTWEARIAALEAPAVGVVQFVSFQDGAVATGALAIPNDNSIPQITEGVEYMDLIYTPLDALNILKIETSAFFSHTNTANSISMALFEAGNANALASAKNKQGTSDTIIQSLVAHTMVAGVITALTFSVRIGSSSGGTLTFNGESGAGKHGGVLSSYINITEFSVVPP